jgi:signal transduction histidine kinase
VDQARALAVEGQAEARQALAALTPAAVLNSAAVDLGSAIDRAVNDHRAMTGGDVRHQLDDLPAVSAAVGNTVLAVLRESLTNIVRHAPDTPVTVTARVLTGDLLLTVVDEPGVSAQPAGRGGLGLAGMRSRAAALGGSLEAGPTPTGWLVRLSIPLDRAAQVDSAAAGTASR